MPGGWRGTDRLPYRTVARERPVEATVYVFLPLVLAVVQVANGVATDFPTPMAIGFAVVMTVYALLASRYHRAAYRVDVVASDLR